ncbi:MAG: hypothetical protein RI947_1557 [Candidatus Parcubacteria bacterium]|jgi:hypothetical protein
MAQSKLHGSREYRHVLDRLRFFINLFNVAGVIVGCLSILGGIVLGILTLIFHQISAWDFAVVLISGGILAMLWAAYGDPTKSRTVGFVAVTLLNGYNASIKHGIYTDAEDRSVLEAKVIRKAYPHVDRPFSWFIPLWAKVFVVAGALDMLVTIILRGYEVWPFDIITRRDMVVMAIMSAQALFIALVYDSAVELTPRNMTLVLAGSLVVVVVLTAIGIYAHYATLDLYLPLFVNYIIQKLVEEAVWLAAIGVSFWLLVDTSDASASKEVS